VNTAYIQIQPKLVGPIVTATEGLRLLGYHLEFFDANQIDDIRLDEKTLVVGFIEVVRRAVQRITGTKPPVINYPAEIISFAHRSIWMTDLGDIRNSPASWPVFIKPADDIKSFGGRVVRGCLDLCPGLDNSTKLWASECVAFFAEFRCFIQDREVVGCRHYRGAPLLFPDPQAISEMVAAWNTSPRAYCLDVGVCSSQNKPKTVLVEINDAYSAGDYGLQPIIYARWLETRWAEMTGLRPIP
jgi:hypothetical protein